MTTFKKPVVLPGVILGIILLLSDTAMAQQASARYKNAFNLSGYLLRSVLVCPDRKKLRAERALGLIATPELKALAASFPQQTRAWSAEGAATFNAGVMQYGIAHMCK